MSLSSYLCLLVGKSHVGQVLACSAFDHGGSDDRKIGATERFKGRTTGQSILRLPKPTALTYPSRNATKCSSHGRESVERGHHRKAIVAKRRQVLLSPTRCRRYKMQRRLKDGGLENGEEMAVLAQWPIGMAVTIFCRTNFSVYPSS